jgi:hypothetical protein
LFCGSLVFGDWNQSVVAGLGLLLNHGIHGTHGKESLHGYALFPCIQVIPWFSGFRGQEPIRGCRTRTFLNHGTHGTHGRESLHGYALFPCIQVVPWFPGFRGQEPIRGRWTGTFFKPRNTRNTRKGILARSCLVSVYSGCSVVP